MDWRPLKITRNDEYGIEGGRTVALDYVRSKKPWRIYGGGVRGAYGETFGLVARQGGRRGILLDLCMSLPILLILAGRHPPSKVIDIVAAKAINQKDLWCELC